MQRTFDVEAVREQFPALGRTHNGRGVVYFDGPGGSQVARQAIEAIAGYMKRGGANLHGVFPTSTEIEEILSDTREAAADFLGAAPDDYRRTRSRTRRNIPYSTPIHPRRTALHRPRWRPQDPDHRL